MPKQTFFNLAEEKRNAILETAIEEFAANDYQSASISRMVAQLGIAKGSFYQYFEDKQDLYFYVLDHIMQARLAFVAQHTHTDQARGFWIYVQDLLESGFRYDLAHPRMSQVLYRAMFGDGAFHRESLNHLKTTLLDYQHEVLKQGVTSGDIDPTINLNIAAHMLNAIMGDFATFVTHHLKLDAKHLIQGNYAQLEMEGMRELVTQVMHILKFGLANKNGDQSR